MFDRRLPGVVPMDYEYLAQHDGSEMGQGRGSGLDGADESEGGRRQQNPTTSYMHMTFHPLERRLDVAIWRAMFASSVKQARRFVVSGAVKVNGKKFTYASYNLNPGDMFSVEPEMVMFATGEKKVRKDSPQSTRYRNDLKEKRKALAEEREERRVEDKDSDAGAATLESNEDREAMSKAPENQDDPKKALRSLMVRASRILDGSKQKLSGKRQQELREFSKSIKKTMSKLRGIEEDNVDDTIDGLETGLAEILTKIPVDDVPREARADSSEGTDQTKPPARRDLDQTRKDAETLHAAMARANENPIDRSKPYATPWRPREFMSAFAFIPRYLEVNQNICSAVYLRHPVARPGLAEVPTPFHQETMGLAFNWYLRRR